MQSVYNLETSINSEKYSTLFQKNDQQLKDEEGQEERSRSHRGPQGVQGDAGHQIERDMRYTNRKRGKIN